MASPTTPISTSLVAPAPFGVDMPSLDGSILLVEDESFVREVTAEILETAGYRVLKARSAAEGMRQYLQHPGQVALLLVDVVLPGKNGHEMVRELKRDNPTLKAIFISGYPQGGSNKNRALIDKAHYLAKPFSLGSLMQKVRDAIVGD